MVLGNPQLGGEPAISAPGTLGHSGRTRRPRGPDGLLQRPGGVGGRQASPASVRGGPGRPVGQPMVPPPGDGGWQVERGLFPAGE